VCHMVVSVVHLLLGARVCVCTLLALGGSHLPCFLGLAAS
jgi:hypothetical protein